MTMIDSIIRNPDACIWLARMKQEDNYIYEHSLGASIWAVALGGLLFDVGKLQLDKDLMKANRKLTAEEIRFIDLMETTCTDDGNVLEIINSLQPDAYGIDMTAIEL